MKELEQGGFLRKRSDGSYSMSKDLGSSDDSVRTVNVPLVGTVTCGAPILAQENIEAMIPVSTALDKPGRKYFMLRAKGDSMNEAGINDRDLILVRQQNTAENGQAVVALIDDVQRWGTSWLQSLSSLAIMVPSVTSPDYNILINPGHSDFGTVKIIGTAPITLEDRLI